MSGDRGSGRASPAAPQSLLGGLNPSVAWDEPSGSRRQRVPSWLESGLNSHRKGFAVLEPRPIPTFLSFAREEASVMRKRQRSPRIRGLQSLVVELFEPYFAGRGPGKEGRRGVTLRLKALEERHMMSVVPATMATYSTDNSSGTSESTISVTGDTADEGTSVEVTINDTLVGNLAIDSSGDGALTVPTANLATTVAAISAVNIGSEGGVRHRQGSTSNASLAFTAPLTDVSGVRAICCPSRSTASATTSPIRRWGAANTDFTRWRPANFRMASRLPNGQTLPSARAISNLIANQDVDGIEQDMNNNRSMSDFVYAWGQFIDHDIDLTESGTVAMNIPVPAGDPTFDPTDQGDLSIAFDRSQIAPGTGTSTSNPAQFVNQDTSFIDGSMIYGSDADDRRRLADFQRRPVEDQRRRPAPLQHDGPRHGRQHRRARRHAVRGRRRAGERERRAVESHDAVRPRAQLSGLAAGQGASDLDRPAAV